MNIMVYEREANEVVPKLGQHIYIYWYRTLPEYTRSGKAKKEICGIRKLEVFLLGKKIFIAKILGSKIDCLRDNSTELNPTKVVLDYTDCNIKWFMSYRDIKKNLINRLPSIKLTKRTKDYWEVEH